MALLDCICCWRHRSRTGACWDSPDEFSPRMFTYSCLIEHAQEIRRTLISSNRTAPPCPQASLGLRHDDSHSKSRAPVGIYGRGCPEVLCAILGIMAIPAPYMPLDLCQLPANRWRTLSTCGVNTLLIDLSLFCDFLSELNSLSTSTCVVKFDATLCNLGLVICYIQWSHQPGSHDSHVTQVYEPPHITAEFNAALKDYEAVSDSLCCSLCLYPRRLKGASPCTEYTGEVIQTSIGKDSSSSTDRTYRPLTPDVHPASVAYYVHTTGSTGEPKLVRVPHCCVVPNIVDLRERFAMSPDDVVFNAAPLTFDPSVVEIFLTFSSGACLLMVPTKVKQSPRSLSTVLFERQFVSVLQATPSLVRQLPERDICSRLLGADSHLRVLAFGGEACPTMDVLAEWKSPKNNTAIFNIYGITEVSSWATCYKVTAEDLARNAGTTRSGEALPPVPIGSPLLGTQVELRSEGGASSNCGSGFIWIGGSYRSCLLGDETFLYSGVKRATGDRGHMHEGGRLVYDGRCDRQIKRLGHRINLDHIQQSIEGLACVASCAVVTITREVPPDVELKLVAFVVLVESSSEDDDKPKLSLFAEMKEILTNYCIPDHIEILKQLPINDHGKVDIKKLEQLYYQLQDQIPPSATKTNEALLTIESLIDLLKSSAEAVLGLKVWTEEQSILELGASSFDVVRLANQVEEELKRLSPSLSRESVASSLRLVEYLLEKPLSGVAACVHNILSFNETFELKDPPHMRDSSNSKEKSLSPIFDKSRLHNIFSHDESEEPPPSKKLHTMDTKTAASFSKEIASWRRGQYFINGRLKENVIEHSFSSLPFDSDKLVCSFEIKWKVSTGKCVDASPLLVQDESHDYQETVYIGSHSGKFFAICFQTGRTLWVSQLSDRIEASACVSVCGQFVTVGCYDGSVFTVCSDSGTVHWCIKPGGSSEPVKSSPAVDPVTGLVWVGSHDHHVYALNVCTKSVVHRIYPGGGSCFSSPCVNSDKRVLYCATLQGKVTAINLDTGDILWTHCCPKPVFSSLALLPSKDSIVIGCVDGGVYVIGSDGQLVAVLISGSAVFSSACCVRDCCNKTKIYCGSHDKHIYCWNLNLELEWKSQELDSEIYSIPFVTQVEFKSSHPTHQFPVLLVCTSSGYVYALNPENGQIFGQFSLPWDVFSSPVVRGNHITVGCRDDHIYSIAMHWKLCENPHEN